ncbi:uncharacterized protein LOC120695439 [Panicum virgatum]|uniref:uncharacterized protein LOC120695439 n=1 Tax=Panicum virgatum TaxID=38727 RepID=UPI0019D51D2C|nr:uncharacterized protein LOC120695439 [Panicum virgatum]
MVWFPIPRARDVKPKDQERWRPQNRNPIAHPPPGSSLAQAETAQALGGLRSRSRRWRSAGNWPGHWAGASVAAPTAASGHRPPARGQSPRAARLRHPSLAASRACAAARLRGLHAAPLRRCCQAGCWRAPTGCCRVGLNRAEEVLVLHSCSLQGPRATASAQHTRMSKRTIQSYFSSSSASTPHTNESTSEPKKSRVEFSHSDFIGDPEMRKPIDDYQPEIRDQVKRAYALNGPTQPRDIIFPRK